MLAPVLKCQLDRHPARAVQDDHALVWLKLAPRGCDVKIIGFGETGQHLHVIGRRRVRFCPRRNRPLLERQRLVRDDQLLIEQLLLANPVTRRTRPLRRVEREQARFDFLDCEAGDGAGEFLAKDDAIGGDACAFHLASACIFFFASGNDCVRQIDIGQPLSQFQRGFKRIRQPRFKTLFDGQPIDHDLDVMLELLVERGSFLDRIQLAIDADTGEARLLPLGHFLAIFALAPAHYWREQISPSPLRQSHHTVDHLADRLRGNRLSRRWRVRHAHPRPQKPHIVVNLGDGCDGRARVAAGCLLLDTDCRRKPVNMLDIGLLHHFEELARIGRQALDIAALSLSIDCIESKRGFARARQPRHHDQRIARQININPFKVMLARAAHRYLCECHARALGTSNARSLEDNAWAIENP